MHLQSLSPSKFNLDPTSFSTSARFFIPLPSIDPYTQLVCNWKTKNGFCSVRKRASKASTFLSNHGGLVSIRCEGLREKNDGFYMRRCVELAKKAIGCTSPNPMVGCVIVKDGVVVGEGFHPKAGQPHAEVFALRDAGNEAENATAYVSLEPCNHYGRTPPCTEALIRANVKRVVVGMVDPNPIVASKGVEKLRESGIDVTVGVEEELCKKLNEAYIHRMLTGKPFVTLRCSVSVNGQILYQLGEGAKEPGGYYSQLLHEYDGVILSSASLAGNSSFSLSQEPQAKQPLQIIVARALNSPVQFPLTTKATTQVTIFTEKNTVADTEKARPGIEMVFLDQLNLNTILEYCGSQGLCSILLDLQGNYRDFEELLEEGLQHGLLQKVILEILPFWVEREESSILRLLNLDKRMLRLKKLQPRVSNETVLVDGYF